MKSLNKLIAVVLLVVLCLSFAGCKAPEYVASEDAAVMATYIEDGSGYIVTKQLSAKSLSGIQLACLYFDAEGAVIEKNYKLFDCDISGSERVALWNIDIPDGCAYIDAIVSAVYGTDEADNWKTKALNVWAREAKKSFTIAGHEAKLAAVKQAEAYQAESNDYVKVTSAAITKGILDFELVNNCDRDIKTVTLLVLWLDENGAPINTNEVSYCPNGKWLSADDLDAGESATFAYEPDISAGTPASVKYCIDSIEFEDGSLWLNENFYIWVACNRG